MTIQISDPITPRSSTPMHHNTLCKVSQTLLHQQTLHQTQNFPSLSAICVPVSASYLFRSFSLSYKLVECKMCAYIYFTSMYTQHQNTEKNE